MKTTLQKPVQFHVRQPRLHLPVMRGVIERRMLLNFRCDPATVAKLVPEPFRPKLVDGFAMAGICLIRLGGVRTGFLPPGVGFSSENAAHRITAKFDSAFLMRGIPHQWRARGRMECNGGGRL